MLVPLFIASGLAAFASAECTREFLKSTTSSLLEAQSMGMYGMISALSPTTNYTESFKPVNISNSILSKTLAIDYNISIHDPVLCTTFTSIIVTDKARPYVVGYRMELNANSSKISKIETLVTHDGDWLFNATGYKYYTSLENWAPIPEAQRDTRAVIKAAGDAYFDRFANANVSVPWGTPCARLEGGAYTGTNNMTGNTCSLGLPSTIKVVDRRYVVDEEMGAVDIYVGFPGLDRASPDPTPDSHMFRVEKGKLRYIHTLSTCDGHPGCGLTNNTFPGRRSLRL